MISGAGALVVGDHDRQVLGPAAGHHRIDGDLLDGGPAEVGRHQRDQLVGRAAGGGDGGLHALAGGRHDRQPVGHATRVELFEGVCCSESRLLG